MISPSTDPIGIEIIERLAEIGFDYIELSLRDMMSQSQPVFSSLIRRVKNSGIRCEACNNFFPPEIRLTGNEANPAAALAYAREALERAARLGARIIVFGSSGARNVPAGFPHEAAFKQLVGLLQSLGPLAEQHGIVIAIEPLNSFESNIINLASSGLKLAQKVHHPRVQLLIDYYHLIMEKEGSEIILLADSAIGHVHFARPEGRVFPKEKDRDSALFFSCLRQVRYSGKCSIEAYTDDFEADARRALRLLRELAERSSAWPN